MRKLFAVAAAAFALAVCCFAATAAENTVEVSASVPTEVSTGAQITVSVDFSKNTGFNTLGVKLKYPEGFTYAEATASDLIAEKCYLDFAGYAGETYVFYHDEEAKTVTFVGASLYDITETSGTLFSVKFTTPQTATENAEFIIEIVDNVYDEAGDVITVDKTNGTVKVNEGPVYKLGDVNMDGYIDNIDGMIIFQYDVGLRDLTAAQLKLADVNGDDYVDNIDAMIIFQRDVGLRDESFKLLY